MSIKMIFASAAALALAAGTPAFAAKSQSQQVAASDAGPAGTTRVTLARAPVLAVAPGVLVELSEGCDRSLATCAARFGNAVNFRGEPYLPGIDLLTRYPGA